MATALAEVAGSGHVDSLSPPPPASRPQCCGQPRAGCESRPIHGATGCTGCTGCRDVGARSRGVGGPCRPPAHLVLATRPSARCAGALRCSSVHVRTGPSGHRPDRVAGTGGASGRCRSRDPCRRHRWSRHDQRHARVRTAEHLRTRAGRRRHGLTGVQGPGHRLSHGPIALRRLVPAPRGPHRLGLRGPASTARRRSGHPAALWVVSLRLATGSEGNRPGPCSAAA